MFKPAFRLLPILLVFVMTFDAAGIHAQRERQMPPPGEEAYGSKFFEQLRSIFGIFRDSDLRRAFQEAKPIQCSELIVGKGEWRTVAFYNEDRSLGEWCRNSLDEVKSDLSVYTFKGLCRGDQGTLQVTTEFPVATSIEAYNAGRIGLNQIDVNVNAPVSLANDPGTQAYVFELPYLFLTGRRSAGNIYSLIAPNVQAGYATEVANRWECKAVRSNDVTYRFLICRTSTVARGRAARGQNRDMGFGATAYFILSDGIEAKTSVNLTFGDEAPAAENAPATATPVPTEGRPALTRDKAGKIPRGWQMPEARSKIVDAGKGEFRLRFSPQTWAGKIGSPEILSDQKMSSMESARMQDGVDYCSWRPGAANLMDGLLANDADAGVSYSLESSDRTSRMPASIVFDMKDSFGARLGTLRCFFPGIDSAANIDLYRWISVVGSHLTLEIRR